jgi:hypothetical protein
MVDLKGITLIVTGFPRSGTSMMMRMLRLGGIDVLRDPKFDLPEHRHQYDPYGVDEIDDVGPTVKAHDKSWTANKAVKMVTPFVEWYPIDRSLKVIFMLRDQAEIITSLLAKKDIWGMDIIQSVMVARRFLEKLEIPTLFLQYHEVVAYPKTTALRIQDFLGVELDIENMKTGADANARKKYQSDPTLYQHGERLLSLNPDDYRNITTVETVQTPEGVG